MMASTTEVAPIIVTALFGRQDTAFFDAMRREHFPPERNQLDSHLTLFHHLPPSGLDELLLRRVNARIERVWPWHRLHLGGILHRSHCDISQRELRPWSSQLHQRPDAMLRRFAVRESTRRCW